jgi:hypothetical protein
LVCRGIARIASHPSGRGSTVLGFEKLRDAQVDLALARAQVAVLDADALVDATADVAGRED